MSLAAVLVTLSLCWLGWRAVQLWNLPLTVVLRHLQIEIPSAPRLTIDALTHDSISLHWTPSDSHVKKHIIYTNGQEVGISTKGETSVRISGLLADHLYSIQVVAVNAQGFQMASLPTHVRTRPSSQLDVTESRDVRQPHIETFGAAVDSKISARHPRKPNSIDIKPTDVQTKQNVANKTTDAQRRIDELTSRMESLNRETADVDSQLAQLTENHAQEEQILMKRLEEARSKKKEEDEAKSIKDQQHKHLDQQKREVEFRRNQVQKALKIEQEELRRQTTDIASFKSSVQNSIETMEHLEESLRTLQTDTDEAIEAARRASELASEELSEVESEIRYLLTRKAESEAELAKLQDKSRIPEPSAQEMADAVEAEAAWQEREAWLMKQHDDAQRNLLSIQNKMYASQDVYGLNHASAEAGVERQTSIHRKVSRRGRADEHIKSTAGPSPFNPDAVPFVASVPTFTNNDNTINNRHPNASFNMAIGETYQSGYPYAQSEVNFPAIRSTFQAGINHGSSSIFSDEPSMLRSASPFARRGSAKSSQSGSNPPSPAIQTRPVLPSIFNTNAAVPARNSSTSLVDRLNGTPLDEHIDNTITTSTDGSKWFWPTKKKTVSDQLLLDRKSARSLPKTDVAPIGTRRNRSGSLREDAPVTKITARPVSNGYHDVDLLNAIGHPLSRETSMEKDLYAAVPLPVPSRVSAFGWDSQLPSTKRRLINPWRDSEHQTSSASKLFDPFADLPARDGPGIDEPGAPAKYHTTIDASRLSALDRAVSNGSKKSSKSKAESHDSRDKIKLLGDTKFSSFVGRVFGKNTDAEDVPGISTPAEDEI